MTGQMAKDYAKYDNHKRIVYEIYVFNQPPKWAVWTLYHFFTILKNVLRPTRTNNGSLVVNT